MKKQLLLLALLLLLAPAARADEGMWMPGNLNRQTGKVMKSMGLKMSPRELYSEKRPSLKDAVVSFGGFCSGVVVSEQGLVFTNHHCGFSAIQQHSTVEHDYLRDGFVARSLEEELPNPELYVRFLLRQEEVTERVLSAVGPEMDESARTSAIDSVRYLIGQEVMEADSTLVGVVDAYYGGSEFWLSVYQDFNDVRLVFAPPSSIGKFGWDTDNWEWPRHTGDFSVFRIYANRENRPADYSPDNVPYRPRYVAPISLEGYSEGEFCMTMGYPGSTERYLSSYGIQEMVSNRNQAMIDVRGVKQAIWKRAMEQSDTIRIKYASKYDESSNYWKNSIGVNRAVQKLKVLEKKRRTEQELLSWMRHNPGEELQLLTDLELAYRNRSRANHAFSYFVEAFLNGPELIQQAWSILNFDFEGDERSVTAGLKEIVERYKNLDPEIDKEVFTALLGEYRNRVDSLYLPPLYHTIRTDYNGNLRAYVDTLYAHTRLATVDGLRLFLERDTTYNLLDDPAISLSIDLLTQAFEMNLEMQQPNAQVERGERLLTATLRRMYADRRFYPDANGTMRLSFGTVCGYTPFDGATYHFRTTTQGILEKVRTHAGDPDFALQPDILRLLRSDAFGRYADRDGRMPVCFISNNDITGGNSGSAMFDARGRLLGLAFDGNWEAMSSDLLYEPRTQRCIGVDVRYILFIIEKWGAATRLMEELLPTSPSPHS
ncbi:MAG: S46 family peptidase [Bacteroides sp.]|nr:S46 family peptidase [Bacteroides sp.]